MKTYLLDTQILIWTIGEDEKIKTSVKAIMADINNEILFSQFSLIEITIKLKLGKLPDFVVSVESMALQLVKDGFSLLKIKNEHIEAYQKIHLFADHRDPFDRLLLATALHENIPIIAADEKFQNYSTQIEIMRAW